MDAEYRFIAFHRLDVLRLQADFISQCDRSARHLTGKTLETVFPIVFYIQVR
jgi:hypothetical protein